MNVVNYKLGKLPKKIDKRTLRLKDFLVLKNLPPLPDVCDVDSAFSYLKNNHMYGNDQYGDCVMAGRAHQTLRFECFEQNKCIAITDKEVEDEYFKETGGLDSGLVMLDSLNEWRKIGWTAARQQYDIHAYAEIDKNKHDELKYTVLLLRGGYTGFSVPQSCIDQFDAGQVWTVVPNSPIVGGHCVYIKAYNLTGPICVTWGRDQQMTWEFWDTYFDEAYAVIDNRDSWMDPATDPLDLTALDAQLAEITSSPPSPPPPTPSPCKVGNGIAKIGNFFCWLLHRRGRFYYQNPPIKAGRIKIIISNLLPLILIGLGLMLAMFSLWQLDIMLCQFVWSSCLGNIQTYQGLINCGFNRFADSGWFTINAELFPCGTFTTGFWYDALMMTNILSWFLTTIGAYTLHSKVQTYKNYIRKISAKLTAKFRKFHNRSKKK